MRAAARRRRVAGDAAQAMRLNLESRLAQRVLWSVAEARTATRTSSTRSRAASLGRLDHAEADLARGHHGALGPLKSLNFAVAAHQGRGVRPAARGRRRSGPNVDTRGPICRWCCTSTPSCATLYVDSSGVPLFKRGWRERSRRCAAEGNAGCRDAGRRRLARHAPRTRRCSTRAAARARSPSRRRRSPATSRPGWRAASRSRSCCRFATPAARRARRASRGKGARAREPRCRSSPATCRSGWPTSRNATPSAPASPLRSSSRPATRCSAAPPCRRLPAR